jgi:hypothetical protein
MGKGLDRKFFWPRSWPPPDLQHLLGRPPHRPESFDAGPGQLGGGHCGAPEKVTSRLRFFPELTGPLPERNRVGSHGSLHLAKVT